MANASYVALRTGFPLNGPTRPFERHMRVAFPFSGWACHQFPPNGLATSVRPIRGHVGPLSGKRPATPAGSNSQQRETAASHGRATATPSHRRQPRRGQQRQAAGNGRPPANGRHRPPATAGSGTRQHRPPATAGNAGRQQRPHRARHTGRQQRPEAPAHSGKPAGTPRDIAASGVSGRSATAMAGRVTGNGGSGPPESSADERPVDDWPNGPRSSLRTSGTMVLVRRLQRGSANRLHFHEGDAVWTPSCLRVCSSR